MRPILHRAVSVAFALAAFGLISLSTVFAPALERSFHAEQTQAQSIGSESDPGEPSLDGISRPGGERGSEHRATSSDLPSGIATEMPGRSFSASVTVVRISALDVDQRKSVRLWQWPREVRGR